MTWWRLAVDLAAVLGWGRTLRALWRRPALRYRAGRIGKVAAMVVAAATVSTWFGVLVPWGAAWMWWRVVMAERDPYELPMADGRPVR